MRALLVTLALASTGVAQEVPPPIIAPPPPISWRSGIDFDQQLKERGRRNKIAGGVLIGLGSAILAAGQVLTIYALENPQQLYVINGTLQNNPSLCGPHGCDNQRYNTGMIAGGAVMAVAGAIMTLVGIPVYAVGGSEMHKASLRMTASGMRLEF
jgi:hypothetical protein